MSTIRCPHCNSRIQIESTDRRRSKTFQSSARSPLRLNSGQALKNAATAIAPPPPISSPVGLPSMESHVHVPANQALVGGCLVAPAIGLTVFSIAYIGNISTGTSILSGVIAGGITMFSTAAWQWFTKTAFYDSLLIQEAESYLGVDLDGDGEIGAIRTEVRVNNNWKYADLPCDRGNEKALVDFLAAVIQGSVTFSERGAINSGYNVDRFKDLRAVFIRNEFAYRKGKADNSPIIFTVSGNALMRDVVRNPPPDNYELDADRGMSGHYVEKGGKRESWS